MCLYSLYLIGIVSKALYRVVQRQVPQGDKNAAMTAGGRICIITEMASMQQKGGRRDSFRLQWRKKGRSGKKTAYSSAQPRARSTARRQRRIWLARACSGICGTKVSSSSQNPRSSSVLFQMPAAKPAK